MEALIYGTAIYNYIKPTFRFFALKINKLIKQILLFRFFLLYDDSPLLPFHIISSSDPFLLQCSLTLKQGAGIVAFIYNAFL